MATIGRYYLLACSSAASKKGVDTKTLISLAGIAPTTKQNSQQRINDSSMVLLLNGIANATNDSFLGFGAKPVPLAYFEHLLQSLYYCQSLDKAVLTLKTALNLVGYQLSYKQDTQHVTLTFPKFGNDPQHFLLEYLMVFVHRILSWLSGKAIQLTSAQISYYPADYQEEFTFLFRCPSLFNQPANTLIFATENLERPIVRTRKDFAEIIAQFPLLVLRYPGEENALNHQVHQLLSNAFLNEKRILQATDIAKKLNMSSATLRRKLAKLATSFGDIKADFLRDQALVLLKHPKNTTETIASELGYSEARAFSRVFKQWTNVTPSQYRKLL